MWGSFDYYLWKQRRVHSSVIIWSVEGTSQNCTKLCPIKTRPTLSIMNKLSPIITQLETLHFLTRALFLWREESANMILCTRCVTMEKTGVSNSLYHSFSLSLSHTDKLSPAGFHNVPPRCGPKCAKPSGRSAVNTRSAPPKPRDEIWQQMSQRSKTAVVFTTSQTHSVFLNYDNAKQCHPNHRGRVSISLSSHWTRGDSLLCNNFFPASFWQKRQWFD